MPLVEKLDDPSFMRKIQNNPGKYYTDDIRQAINLKESFGNDKGFSSGQSLMDFNKSVARNETAKNDIKKYRKEYRQTHGITGAYNKVGKAYDTVTGFGNDNLNRFNRGRNLYYGIAAAGAGVAAASAKKKKEKERKRQQELQQYYYQ